MYYVGVHKLPHAVLVYSQKHHLLQPGDRVGVAVSGGADSVALLLLLLALRGELGIVVSLVHVNHQLRGAASVADEQFVRALAMQHDLDFHLATRDVAGHASENSLSIETAARQVRYQYFDGLLAADQLNRIATGHTLDDQAETVLMRMIRGTGVRGLGGIQPQLFGKGRRRDLGTVIRPLLATRHHELEAFLAGLGQNWRRDESNSDLQHTRNRIRHLLMPLLEQEFNPAVAERLHELSAIAREEEQFWQAKCSELAESMVGRAPHSTGFCLDLKLFNAQPLAVRRQLLQYWARTAQPRAALEFRHIEQIVDLASAASGEGKQLELPAGWRAVRQEVRLLLTPPDLVGRQRTAGDYRYRLAVPGSVVLPEACLRLETISIPLNDCSGSYNPDQLLDPSLLARELIVRNWCPGDRFWPAHRKAPKKVKELLQEKHVGGPQKKLWPVVVSEGEIVWLPGFACRAQFQARPGNPAVLIRALPHGEAEEAGFAHHPGEDLTTIQT
jgi:tRNA(Ile)-lysidine synthase